MSDIYVIAADTLVFDGTKYRCTIGKNGFTKGTRKEGSNTTPTGYFALRECWYRPDRVDMPLTVLPIRKIEENDGWCDDATHPLYNRAVKLPFTGSHEKLWRDDNMYNLIVPMGFNDDPVIPGLGSAIFLHVAKPDYAPTEGCVALAQRDLLVLLAGLTSESRIIIEPSQKA